MIRRWFGIGACLAAVGLALPHLRRGPERVMDLPPGWDVVKTQAGQPFLGKRDPASANLLLSAMPAGGSGLRQIARIEGGRARIALVDITPDACLYALTEDRVSDGNDEEKRRWMLLRLARRTGRSELLAALPARSTPAVVDDVAYWFEPRDAVPTFGPGSTAANGPYAVLVGPEGGVDPSAAVAAAASAGFVRPGGPIGRDEIAASTDRLSSAPDGRATDTASLNTGDRTAANRNRLRAGIRGPARWDLMATPLDGRPTRRLAAGLHGGHLLDRGPRGLYLWRWQSSPNNSYYDLVRVNYDEPARTVLPICRNPLPPVDVDGRLFWLERFGKPESIEADMIMASSSDGSERRMLLRMDSDDRVSRSIGRLWAHRGRIYCLVHETNSPATEGRRWEYRSFFCQIVPGARDTIRKLFGHSAEVFSLAAFEGDSAFFAAREIREDWLDWSSTGLNGKSVHTLYRFRLPR